VVVGAGFEDSSATGIDGDQGDTSYDSGAAYVFVREGTTWSQQAYLKASYTGARDLFGFSVGVSGDTVVVGAPQEASSATGDNGNPNDNSAGYSGAAYLFQRDGTTWSQRAYLKASNTGPLDNFGNSVAIAGDTLVSAAILEDSDATGVNGDQASNRASDSGAVYVFPSRTRAAFALEQSDGTVLASGAAVDFGSGAAGVGSEHSFTIRNTGNADLTGVTVTIDGAQAAEFELTVGPAATVPPGGRTTFTVTFTPAAEGPRTAALHIAGNAGLGLGFDLTLNGEGLITPPDLAVEILSITRDAAGNTRLVVRSQAGQSYTLEVSEDLRNWNDVQTVISTEDDILEFTGLASELPQLFYRVRRE
jgi:hypothetical protein